MAIVIKPITVEVSKPNVFQAIAAKQNDSNSRFLKVTFVNEGEKINVIPSAKVTINAERKDGQSNSFFGEVNDDGTVTVPIHSWILELPGYVDCDVSIIEEDSKLTSTTFSLLVEEAAHGSDDISTDEQKDVLGELINDVKAMQSGGVFGNAIVKTASGTMVGITDISPLEHILRVKASSQNLIPFPYYRTSGTYEGVAFTVNNDTSITMKGTAENNIYFYLVIANAYGTTSMNALTNASATNGEYVLSKRLMYSVKDKETFVYIAKGETVDETIYPMLAKGTILPPWTPYVPDFSSIVKLYTTDDYVYSSDGNATETLTRSAFSIDDLDKFIAKSIEQGRTYQNGKESFSMQWTTDGLFYIDDWSGESDALLNEWGISSYGFVEDSQYIVFEVINRDYSKANVQRFGKSIVNIPNIDITTGKKIVSIPCRITSPITISCVKDNVVVEEDVWRIRVVHADGYEQYMKDSEFPIKSFEGMLGTTSLENNPIVSIDYRGTAIISGQYKDFQVEYGKTATKYEPYTEKTYPINPDGTVEGVTSLYPTTTLIPDMEGIVLDATYNVDTQKYIDNKFAELAALIVNS